MPRTCGGYGTSASKLLIQRGRPRGANRIFPCLTQDAVFVTYTMKKYITLPSVVIFSLFSLQCSEKEQSSENSDNVSPGAEMSEVDMVESGTYTGTADKVDPKEMEIYVKLDDGKTIELYLKETTPIMKGTEKVGFDALKEGQKLEVEVEKSGEHLNPVSVKIME